MRRRMVAIDVMHVMRLVHGMMMVIVVGTYVGVFVVGHVDGIVCGYLNG